MSAIKAFNPLGQTIQWQSHDYVIRGFAPASRVADIPFNHGMALLVIVDGRSVYLHESEIGQQ